MRLFCPDLPDSGTIELKTEELNYARNVLRARPMDGLLLFDGKGKEARGVITGMDHDRVSIRIEEVFKDRGKESALALRLLQGMLKGQKMDLVIQKTVELGVTEIWPLVTARTQVNETRKIERWRKIAVEAARQCGRPVAPVIREPATFAGFFGLHSAFKDETGMLFWEEGGSGLKELFDFAHFSTSRGGPGHEGIPGGAKNIWVAVGPEGGFSREEVSMAVEKGFYLTSLGPRILRAETAAIMAVGMAQFLFGDIG